MKEEVPSDLQNEPLVPLITDQLAASLASETPAESEAPSDQKPIEQPPTPTQHQPQHEEAEDPAISEVIDEAIAASASSCNDTPPTLSSFSPPPIAAAVAPLVGAPAADCIVPTGQEQTGRWTREEQERFIQALELYGKEWKKVAAAVQTRTIVQVRTHAQKFQKKLARIFEKGGDGEESEAQLLSAVVMETESVGGRMRLKVDEAELRRLRKLHVLFSTTHGGYGKN
ncbi:hypothetical protein ACHAWX_004724 [Stephanocyclus meneghinianus]